jgi:gluconokinase
VESQEGCENDSVRGRANDRQAMRENRIDLPQAPRVVYFIGLAGAGKSYVGDLIGRRAGYHVYHADQDLPSEMREAIRRNVPWTEEQRDRFYSQVRKRTIELARIHPKLAVTQATYKQKHRELMLEEVRDIEFIWIVASQEVIACRLKERGDYVSVEFFERTKHHFELPPKETKIVINNGGDDYIVRQLIAYYG